VGPPWPKHPCTDQAVKPETRNSAVITSVGDAIAPVLRPVAERRALNYRRPDREDAGPATWYPFVVAQCAPLDDGTRVDLHPISTTAFAVHWWARDQVTLDRGDLVFVRDEWLAYFDVKRLRALKVQIVRLESRDGWTGTKVVGFGDKAVAVSLGPAQADSASGAEKDGRSATSTAAIHTEADAIGSSSRRAAVVGAEATDSNLRNPNSPILRLFESLRRAGRGRSGRRL